MTTEQQYQDTVDGIALARRTVEQTSATIRQAMDNGDDPVIFLHNLSVALGKESPFQAGGQGAAIYTVACFLLAESGFFETTPHDKCICPGPEDGEPTEYLATCPIHRGSWAETLEILADRELTVQLTASIEDLGDPEENFTEAKVPYCVDFCVKVASGVTRHDPRCPGYGEPCCVAHVDLECAIDAPESCCDECPALGGATE